MSEASTATLLVELLTEELPPKALARLTEAFAEGLANRLHARGLLSDAPQAGTNLRAFGTPRRLAVLLDGVRSVAPTRQIREKLLPVSVGLDKSGAPSAPLLKKLAAAGFADFPVADLERAADGKNEAFFISYTAAGATLADGLQQALTETLEKLPIPKVMSYQRPDGATVRFVRPAHGLVALFGDAIVPVSALGLAAGRITRGHRFLSAGSIEIDRAEAYASLLETRGSVVADLAARRKTIVEQLRQAAGDDLVVMPEALIDEVNALVEWPVIYACRFDESFLEVPQECLILTMQTNQKYFALTDAAGRLRSRFLVVSNLKTATPEQIIEGNERVVRPRLADAQFFYQQDRKRPLAERVPLLANVVYHNKLGSQLARTERITTIARAIGEALGENAERLALIERAARLAKADLLTDMVGEFPELQGTMGTYYAHHDGEADEVARACSEHYLPRYSGDALPTSNIGTVVALADKLETLTGIWGIGLAPTGEKDPFALRRQALGVLRILLDKALPLDLSALLGIAYRAFGAVPSLVESTADIYAFLIERLKGLLRERNYEGSVIEAVLAQPVSQLTDVLARLDAVRAFQALPEAPALAAANKRISNILRKSAAPAAADKVEGGDRTADAAASAPAVDVSLFSEPAERALHARLLATASEDESAAIDATPGAGAAAHRYTAELSSLASLREAVDAFFDDVMVNADDPAVRANRLALLESLRRRMNSVADISRLAA
ncbi:MAG: glycine--tRNA ligase subunit beta [Janthinobacterium lividum]